MKQILTLLIGFFVLLSCNNDQNHQTEGEIFSKNNSKKQETFGIVIHGGAGTILKKNMGFCQKRNIRMQLKKELIQKA